MAESPPPADKPANTPTEQPATPAPQAAAPESQAAAPAADAAAAEDGPISQESIDALLKQANVDGPEGCCGRRGDAAAGPGQDLSIEQMLEQANFEDGTAVASEMPGSDARGVQAAEQVMADAGFEH